METALKYPLRYNMEAIILYIISLEISNLLREIKKRSPHATNQLPKDVNVFTPEQIEEARRNFTGFVNSAIAAAAKRQEAMNLIAGRALRIRELVSEVEGILALMIQNPLPVTKEEFGRLNQARQVLINQRDDIGSVEKKLKAISVTINELLAQHAEEWKQHYKKYVDKLIAELATQEIALSELEKQELYESTKTIEEVKLKLQKAKIIK